MTPTEMIVGNTYDNKQVYTYFKVSNTGGMRRSNTTNSLVLFSNPFKGLYKDRWDNDILLYTGMGLEGDQSLYAAQNKTLAESDHNGVTVHLFEAMKPKEYTYRGIVTLAGKPWTEVQPDSKGKDRNVWLFPLQLADKTQAPPTQPDLQPAAEELERKARIMSDEDLTKRAQQGQQKPGQRPVTTSQYERDPFVAELAKRKANGVCQLCKAPAPFVSPKGPYLETHHIVWLSEGGPDTIDNTVALCPNCHRKMHILKDPKDVHTLQRVASQ